MGAGYKNGNLIMGILSRVRNQILRKFVLGADNFVRGRVSCGWSRKGSRCINFAFQFQIEMFCYVGRLVKQERKSV
jgi:hypothetical protein